MHEGERVVTTQKELLLLKTAKGYLHRNLGEGLYLEKGELNYSFTDDPEKAYQFFGDLDIPKYMGIVDDLSFSHIQEVCDYLGGKMVKVKITTIVKTVEVAE